MPDKPKPRKKGADSPGVVRRARSERRQLDPDLEALARGETDKLRRPRGPRAPRLRDPRPLALVPGVANRDARAVFDARVGALRAARSEGDRPALARGLCEAVLLKLWRCRSVTSLEALAQDVVGLSGSEVHDLVQEGAEALGVAPEPCQDALCASWLRTEAGLLEAGIEGRVGLCPGDPQRIRLEILGVDAPKAFEALGRKMRPLAQDQAR